MNKNVDEYIRQFTGDVRTRLETMRDVIVKELPDAEESVSYSMPAYKLQGKPAVYFAGYAGHVGLYATPNGHEAFKDEFSKYKQGKGSVQFPNDQPLPIELITRVVRYRKEQLRAAAKRT